MSTAKKILGNTAIQIIGRVIIAVLSILTMRYITSLEAVPEFKGMPSDYRLIYAYLGFFGIVADFGLFTIGVREMSKTKTPEEQSFVMGNIYGMRLLTIVTLMAAASLVVFLIPFENYGFLVKDGVAIAAVTTVFTMLASTASSVLQVHLKMTFPTIALVLGKIIMTAYIIAVVLNFSKIPYAFFHLLFAGVVGTLITFIMTIFYTKRVFPFFTSFHFPYWKKVFKEALPYGAAVILSTVYFKLDVLLLSFFREKIEIAIYGYPSTLIELLSVFPLYFMNSVFPTLTKAFQESKEKVKKIASLSFQFLVLMTLPLVTGGILLSRQLIGISMHESFLTGNVPGYFGADFAFQLLLISTLFSFLTTVFAYLLIACGNQAKLLKINACGVVFNTVANLIFIPSYGFIAAGIISAITSMVVLLMTFFESRKQVSIPFDMIFIMKISLATLIMGVFVFFTKNIVPVVPLIGIAGMVFLLCVLVLRIVPREAFNLAKQDSEM
ncbi:flippase [Candidatus Peregrinibacteria bacterium]|nr:flippase [Candidatus Peregrinibacteria bacterium]